ncbi:hypothetical protein RD792_003856 [Penstemon davidsonii]|uniref:WAT1-related protein n=1 Tax=Penstemon davidsonii TaxID=160366 RepID=A0ABR0DGF9_9LAMI|nr:hypothetical protein RD792_003856 [Penstemon davidsonii]
MWKPVAMMVVVEFGLSMVNIQFKKGLEQGMNHLITVAYRQIISTIFLFPLAWFWERTSWSELTTWVTGQMFLSALLGLTLSQYLFLVGLDYTSATLTGAFINIVPVVTFVLALPFGMEKVNMKRNSGRAKGIVGSGICFVVMSWCVKQRGPVFTSAFSPLLQIFAAIFDVTILHEEIYLGRPSPMERASPGAPEPRASPGPPPEPCMVVSNGRAPEMN